MEARIFESACNITGGDGGDGYGIDGDGGDGDGSDGYGIDGDGGDCDSVGDGDGDVVKMCDWAVSLWGPEGCCVLCVICKHLARVQDNLSVQTGDGWWNIDISIT